MLRDGAGAGLVEAYMGAWLVLLDARDACQSETPKRYGI